MSKENIGREKESAGEKTGRIYRNFNVLGAVALGAAAMIVPPVLAAPVAGLECRRPFVVDNITDKLARYL